MEFKEKSLEEFEKVNKVENGTLIKYNDTDEFVMIPDGIKAIGNNAFTSNFKVKGIFVTSSVKKILPGFRIENKYECEPDDYIGAFSKCPFLMMVRLSKNIEEIPEFTFTNCINLSEITVPEKVTDIGKMAFNGCVNLEKISLPDGLKSIQMYAFYNCYSVNKIVIPKSVDFIGKYAFSGMSENQTICFECSESHTENFHPAWKSGAECKFVFNYKE